MDIIETAGGKVYIFMILSLHNLLLLVIFKNDISQALRFASITCHLFPDMQKGPEIDLVDSGPICFGMNGNPVSESFVNDESARDFNLMQNCCSLFEQGLFQSVPGRSFRDPADGYEVVIFCFIQGVVMGTGCLGIRVILTKQSLCRDGYIGT